VQLYLVVASGQPDFHKMTSPDQSLPGVETVRSIGTEFVLSGADVPAEHQDAARAQPDHYGSKLNNMDAHVLPRITPHQTDRVGRETVDSVAPGRRCQSRSVIAVPEGVWPPAAVRQLVWHADGPGYLRDPESPAAGPG
jgi:hypothetical protein